MFCWVSLGILTLLVFVVILCLLFIYLLLWFWLEFVALLCVYWFLVYCICLRLCFVCYLDLVVGFISVVVFYCLLLYLADGCLCWWFWLDLGFNLTLLLVVILLYTWCFVRCFADFVCYLVGFVGFKSLLVNFIVVCVFVFRLMLLFCCLLSCDCFGFVCDLFDDWFCLPFRLGLDAGFFYLNWLLPWFDVCSF